MPPKYPKYGSPLLAILRGGKQAVKPPVFGVTQQPTFPTQPLPQAPLSTRQAVQPAPLVQPPQMTPYTPPVQAVNPLDIIRKGKEGSITMPKAGEGIMPKERGPIAEAFLGNRQSRAILRDMQSRGVEPGFFSTWGTEGFWSFMGRDNAEQADRMADTLIKKGGEPGRAIEMAILEMERRDNRTLPPRRKEVEERLKELAPTREEKNTMLLQRAGQFAGSALESLDVLTFGTTAPLRKVAQKKAGKEVDKLFQKVAADMAEEDAVILRNIYVDNKLDTNPLQTNKLAEQLGIEKLDWSEQKETVTRLLKEYDHRWGGIDEVGVATTRPGAMDIKKPAPVKAPEIKDFKTAEEFWKTNDKNIIDIPGYGKANIELLNNGKIGLEFDDVYRTVDADFFTQLREIDGVKITDTNPTRAVQENLSNTKAMLETASKEIKEAAEKTFGFENTTTPIQAGKVKSELVKKINTQDLGEVSYRDYIMTRILEQDYVVSDTGILAPRGQIAGKALNKNQQKFAEYVQNNRTQLIDEWKKSNASTILDPKNFKTAEEYVKAQGGQQMFRSSASPFDVAKMGEDGIFLSPDKKFVEGWQKSQGYQNFEEFVISPKAKILRRKDFPKKFVREEDGFNFTSLDDQADIIKYAKDNGFDGIEDYSFRADGKKIEHEFAIWNKDVIKTHTQLIDEWKSAQPKTPTVPKRDYPGLKSQGGFADFFAPIKAKETAAPKKFGTFNDVDLSQKLEQPYLSRFADPFLTKKSPNGLTYNTLEKMQALDFHLKQAGHKSKRGADEFKGMFSLDKVLVDPVLFAKYPSLKEKNVIFADFRTPKKYGMHVGNDIYINSELYLKDKTKLRSTIVHEIQHAKQDIRGMKGADDEVIRDAKGAYRKAYESEREIDARRKQQQYLDSLSPKQITAPTPPPKKLSEIDRLIADNKVRVVSRDGRDVYQVKKSGEWANVRDEDSAIRQAGPRPLKFSAEGIPLSTRNIKTKRQLPDELEMKLVGLDIAKEALDANPAKELSRYVSKRGDSKGTLAEVTGKQGSKTGIGTDVRIADAGFDNSEDARKAYDDYVQQKEAFKQHEIQVKQEVKDWKATEPLRAKTVVPAKAVDQVRELQKVAPEQVRSLEEASQRIQEVLDVPRNQRPQTLDVIIPQTPVAKKVALWDYIRTPDRVLNKIGFGKEAKMLRNQYEKYVIELPKNIDKVSDWVKRVPKESNERIFDFLDGKPVNLNATELQVAEEIKAYLAEWADRLKLPQDNRVTNYITRLFEDSLIAKEFDEDLAKIIADKVPGEVYNPFLQKRLGAKGYKRNTWEALDAYTKRATRKVHLDPALERIREKAGSSLEFTNLEESQFKYIQTYINRVQMRPTEMDNLIDNGVKQIVGYRFGQRPVAHVSQFLRRMTYRGMLGANVGSAVRNLSQGINTYATLGEKYTVIGYAKLFNTNARKELAEHGVLAQNFIEDRALSSTKKALQKADKAIWFMFDQAEKVNRGAAYFGAKAKGVNMGMNEADAIEYAKSIVRKTQFAFDNVDAPVVMGTDLVKTLAQFQTFTVKQTEFLVEMAKDKNFVGLLRYAVAGYAFVNTVGLAMGMEEKELLPFLRFDVPPSLKFPWETAKLGMVASGVPLEDKYGNELDIERQAGQTGKSLLGLIPGGLQAKKTVDGINMVEDGAAFDRAGKKQFEQTDTPARKVQSVLFGKWASPQAKEYFNKDSKSGDKELDTALSTQKKEDARVNEEAQKQHIALKKLPKEEANAIAKELKANDPAVFEALKKLVKAEEKKAEWTDIDKNIAKLGVANGRRAEYIHTKASQMSKDEANAYIKDLRSKGIITDEVFKQIKELIQNNGIIEQ